MHTQEGMQPIHSAASKGQIDVINILVEKYGVDPQEKADVRTYICDIVFYVYIFMHMHIHYHSKTTSLLLTFYQTCRI